MTRAKTSIAIGAFALIFGWTLQAGAEPLRIGKNAGEDKGRWLEIQDRDSFGEYTVAFIGDVRTDLQYENQQKAAIEGEELNSKMRQKFFKKLVKSKVFDVVLGSSPREDQANAVRLDFDLTVDPGNRAARFVVGLGSGKSRSLLEIHMKDHQTGDMLGVYHGYGVGTGMALKIGGGSATKMTMDDIEENSSKFIELLKKVRKGA